MTAEKEPVQASARLQAVPPRAEDWGPVIGRVAHGDEAALADDGCLLLIVESPAA